MKILVVLSGGQDSTTCLFWARGLLTETDDKLHAVTFDYGQRHRIEIEAARKVASMANVDSHEVIELPNCLRSVSPLIGDDELERYENYEQMERVIGSRVELTFVPMCNTLFLTIAANRAVALGCNHIVIGVCEQDSANYPDCRQSFLSQMEEAINQSLGRQREERIKILAPLVNLSKAQSIARAMELPGCIEALAYSHTSYDGKYPPTDMNHSNVVRAQGFLEAGVPDPLIVRAWREGRMDLPTTANYALLRGDA